METAIQHDLELSPAGKWEDIYQMQKVATSFTGSAGTTTASNSTRMGGTHTRTRMGAFSRTAPAIDATMPDAQGELEAIAEHLRTQMRDGAERWYMPWHKGLEEPYNAVTGRVFGGRNASILWSQAMQRGYTHNQWATLKQWASRRGKIPGGAKGVRVFAPILTARPGPTNMNVSDFDGFRSYHVFNVDVVHGIDADHPDLFNGNLVDDSISDFVKKTDAQIYFGGDRACYKPSQDVIDMPLRRRFFATPHTTAEEGFQSTIVHELVHWTKPSHRADRAPEFEDPKQRYAFEELVAELGAAMICARFQHRIEPRPNHAAYLSSWLTALENDFSYFYKAMSLAQRAVHWLYLKTDTVPDGWVLSDEADGII